VRNKEGVVVRAATAAMDGDKSDTLQSLQNMYQSESPGFANRRRVRFEISDVAGKHMDRRVKEELSAIVEAKHAGVAYIIGQSYIKARKSCKVFKFAIEVAYNFLRKNCRGAAVAINIPPISPRCGDQHTAHQPHRSWHDLLRLALMVKF
jgi:KUP system potassium uptake protein